MRSAGRAGRQRPCVASSSAAPFGPAEAVLAVEPDRTLVRARSRALDLAIAACAITREAELWTLDPRDFSDIPRLRLHSI